MNTTNDNNTHRTDDRGGFDGLLFDMDGTLWDAVDSYCAIWNDTIDRCCPDVPHVTRDRLEHMMGMPLRSIYDELVGPAYPYEPFLEQLLRVEAELMPRLGGRLYPGAKEVIARLARTHRLFMVSNCNADGLPVFLEYTGLKPYFTDHLSFGQTGREKDANIAEMVARHGLKRPLYIGDTAGDCRAAHAAGVPFVLARYGFGDDVPQADFTIDDISQLPDIL